MKSKLLALSLSLLFMAGIATSSVAMVVDHTVGIVKVDDDKDKAKAKKATKSADCAAKKECCEKTCDGKKSAEKKTDGDKK